MYKNINLLKTVSSDGVFQLNKTSFDDILKNSHSKINLQLPIEGLIHNFELDKSQLFGNSFYKKYSTEQLLQKNLGSHYQGKMSGFENSSVAISFTNEGLVGLILDGINQYQIVSQDIDSYKILPIDTNFDFTCGATLPPNYNEQERKSLKKDVRLSESGDILMKAPTATTRCLNVYWEGDTDIYTIKGVDAEPYLTSLFNAVQLLYLTDGIQIYLSDLFVNTGTSLYYPTIQASAITSLDMLIKFTQVRTTFNGDAGQLFSFTKGRDGGVAYIDQLCASQPHAFSYIFQTFKQPFAYSWSVMVATHEHGHTFGSPHTHSCSWNINNFQPGDNPRGCKRIDSCRNECSAILSSGCTSSQNNPGYGVCKPTTDAAGNIINCAVCCAPDWCCGTGPIPVSGGTIMSYCHLAGGPGVNLNFGFGPQPRQRIIDEINSLPLSCIECLGPPPVDTPTPTPTNTLTPTNTTTSTPTKTINASPNPTQTTTPTVTPTLTKTPTVTSTKTPTKTQNVTPNPTTTPTPTTTITPTSCCSRFTLTSSPNDSNGSDFLITNCDGSTQVVNVPNNTSIQYNCAKLVSLQSGLGSFVRYPGCLCTTPTPTSTPTLTPTPTVQFPSVGILLLYNLDVYKYDVLTNTQTFLTTLPFSGSSFFDTNDITHTNSKIFVKGYVGIDFNDPLAFPGIGEWNYTLNPFTITFVKFIELPDLLAAYPGLFAFNNTTLITSSDTDNTPNQIIRIDISGPIPIFNSIVQFPYGYRTFGDYIVTTTNKLIVIVIDFITKNTFIYQYDYNNLLSGPEITKSTGNLFEGRYLFESNSKLYILKNSLSSELYEVGLTYPYNLTFVNNLDFSFYSGASNTYSESNVNLIPIAPTSTPTPTLTPTQNTTECQYCISLHPCTFNKFFVGCCEPYDTYRIYLIPNNVASSLIDGQSYYVESIGFSGCAIYDSALTTANFSYQYINITPQ